MTTTAEQEFAARRESQSPTRRLNVFDAFAVDEDLQDNGLWVEVAVGSHPVGRVKVKPADATLNGAYRRASLEMGKKIEAYFQANAVEQLPADVDLRLLGELYADSVITDWDILGEDGEQMPCTRENILKAFVALPKFFIAVKSQAQKWTNFRRDFESKSVKN